MWKSAVVAAALAVTVAGGSVADATVARPLLVHTDIALAHVDEGKFLRIFIYATQGAAGSDNPIESTVVIWEYEGSTLLSHAFTKEPMTSGELNVTGDLQHASFQTRFGGSPLSASCRASGSPSELRSGNLLVGAGPRKHLVEMFRQEPATCKTTLLAPGLTCSSNLSASVTGVAAQVQPVQEPAVTVTSTSIDTLLARVAKPLRCA